MEQRNKASGAGLERLCPQDWLASSKTEQGVEFLEAWFQGGAYEKHRHATYGICLTTAGVQAFSYRGSAQMSLPGQLVVLHPDEAHDGHAGTEDGFGYRMVYVEPGLIAEAVCSLTGHVGSLPFVPSAVVLSERMAQAIEAAFLGTPEPLAIDLLIEQLAQGMMELDPAYRPARVPRHVDMLAVTRARDYLDAQKARVVRSAELEIVTGLNRFELARQFRVVHGTNPYRYLLMRRLAVAREQLRQRKPLVDIAFSLGFADQAHFSRIFKAEVGMTPSQYLRLVQLPAGPQTKPVGQQVRNASDTA